MIQLSPSTIKVFNSCKFHLFCRKVAKYEQDGGVDTKYADGGTVVHDSIEHYYKNIEKLPLARDEKIAEVKNYFHILWEQSELKESLKIDEYWLCVANAIRLNIKATDIEHEFITNSPVKFRGFADLMNREDHFILDWKTSTYKSAKVDEYKTQVRYYAWCYFKTFGHIPTVGVYFNKVDKPFKWKFKEETLMAVEANLIKIDDEIRLRYKAEDWPREPSSKNCYFCAFKTKCRSDILRGIDDTRMPHGEVMPERKLAKVVPVTFHLKGGDTLLIEAKFDEWIHNMLEDKINYKMKNAHFMIKFYLQKYGKKIDGIKRLYKRKPFGAQCYIGYMNLIYKTLKELEHKSDVVFKFKINDKRDIKSLDKVSTLLSINVPYELYKFQPTAVEQLLRNKWGIVEVGTGGGKTEIAALAILKSKVAKTLFVIDNKDLLLQTKEAYEKMLPGYKCSIVGLGKKDWSGDIVLSTIQTLTRNIKDYQKELAMFNLLIADEVHIWAAKSFEKLSKVLVNTEYRFGFSATAKRDDGDANMIFAFCGSVVFCKDSRELTAEGVLTPAEVKFINYDSQVIVTENWQNEYKAGIVENEARNNAILKLVQKYTAEGKQIMVLCKYVDHCKFLNEAIPDSELIFGKTDDIVRKELLEDFKLGKFQVLIGNIKIFNKGINIKNLNVLINASGNAGDVVTTQSIGRALRKFEGKDIAYYIDFVDKGEYNGAHAKSRIQTLDEQGYSIEYLNISEI